MGAETAAEAEMEAQMLPAKQHACRYAHASDSCDPRIARSKAALRKALIDLMEERGFDGFSINDLCVRAGLNRGTFYNHYRDKESLLQAFEDDIFEGLESFADSLQQLDVKDIMRYKVSKTPLPFLSDLFAYLREHGDFLHAVLGPGGDVRFGPRLRKTVCESMIMSVLHDKYRENPSPFVDYYVAYFAAAYLGVIGRWIETGMKETPDEMALIAMRLLFIRPGESIIL